MGKIAGFAPEARINARLVEHIPIDALKPYPEHARTHTNQQIAKLSRSIRRFGIVAPILIDEANVIIGGHAVVDAAKLLGLTKVPALRVEHLSDAEKRALRLALNRLAEDAEWNSERLATELRFLVDAEFEIDLTGFEVGEIDFRLAEDRPGEEDPEPDEIPLADVPAVTRPGDVWILGHHRLLCGDPREEADLIVRRWQAQTGKAAVDAGTGLTFEKLGEQRERQAALGNAAGGAGLASGVD